MANKRTYDIVIYDEQEWEVTDFSEFTKREMYIIKDDFYCAGITEKGDCCRCKVIPVISKDVDDDEEVDNQLWFRKSPNSKNKFHNHAETCSYDQGNTLTITEENIKHETNKKYLVDKLLHEFIKKSKPPKKIEVKNDSAAQIDLDTLIKNNRSRKRSRVATPPRINITKYINPNDYESREIIDGELYYFRIELLHNKNNLNEMYVDGLVREITLGYKTIAEKFAYNYVTIKTRFIKNRSAFYRLRGKATENPVQLACVGKLKFVKRELRDGIFDTFEITLVDPELIHVEP